MTANFVSQLKTGETQNDPVKFWQLEVAKCRRSKMNRAYPRGTLTSGQAGNIRVSGLPDLCTLPACTNDRRKSAQIFKGRWLDRPQVRFATRITTKKEQRQATMGRHRGAQLGRQHTRSQSWLLPLVTDWQPLRHTASGRSATQQPPRCGRQL